MQRHEVPEAFLASAQAAGERAAQPAEAPPARFRDILRGRRLLRRALRAQGIRSRREFSQMAKRLGLSLGLPGGKSRVGRYGLGLLASGLTLVGALFLGAVLQELGDSYTVSLSQEMYTSGFLLSETADFQEATGQLYAEPAESVPCISIQSIPATVDDQDGAHNDTYFAYTCYLRNQGTEAMDYQWSLNLIDETQDLSQALWFLVLEDGDLRIYAQENRETGLTEALPTWGESQRGYHTLPIATLAPDSDQFARITNLGQTDYWRVIPDPFCADTVIATGQQTQVEPGETHKYTVVFYLEGDDPDATDDLIGAQAGISMDFRLLQETDEAEDTSQRSRWDALWQRLRFWS